VEPGNSRSLPPRPLDDVFISTRFVQVVTPFTLLVFVVRDVGGEGDAFDLEQVQFQKRKKEDERKGECEVEEERGDRMQQ
jgi:hypothetical protein